MTAVLLTPYPPGIPLLIPGERFNKTIVQYLQFARAFNERFPGFETDIHGLVEERTKDRTHYYMDCVRQVAGIERQTVGARLDEQNAVSDSVESKKIVPAADVVTGRS